MTTGCKVPETEVPAGFYRVPARCGCGADHLVLSVRPAADGEVRDRKCDRCAEVAAQQVHEASNPPPSAERRAIELELFPVR